MSCCPKHNLPMTIIACGDLINVKKELKDNEKILNKNQEYFVHSTFSKTFHYVLNVPTAAPFIGFIGGHFEMDVDPHMHELTNFCLPTLKSPSMVYTNSQVHTIFEFYEELLSSRFPFSCYKQIFVDEFTGFNNSDGFASFATFSIIDARLLYNPLIIDQVWITRRCLALAIALQFFGRFLTSWLVTEYWLLLGISGYITDLYIQKVFGYNEYRYFVHKSMETLYKYETSKSPVLLDASKIIEKIRGFDDSTNTKRKHKHHNKESKNYNNQKEAFWFEQNKKFTQQPFPPYFNLYPSFSSSRYIKMLEIKARLFVRMIQYRIGKNMLIQVFNKLLTLATNASTTKPNKDHLDAWNNMLLSVSSFLKFIYTVTGKDLQSFFDLWVYQAGLVNIYGSYSFSRKKSILELDLRQEINKKAHFCYVGPLQVRVQEMDGNFLHTVNIENGNRKYDIPCQSKTKTYRNKKKKVPLCNGDEADIDLTMAFETECPVLWVTLDPDLLILGSTQDKGINQPDYQYQMMLKYERDVVSQCRAIKALSGYSAPIESIYGSYRGQFYNYLLNEAFLTSHPGERLSATIQTRNLLNEIIEDTTVFILNNPSNIANTQTSTHHHSILMHHHNSQLSQSNPNSSNISNLLNSLGSTIHHKEAKYNKHFYRVRVDAAFGLAKIANNMTDTWAGPSSILNIFYKLFCNLKNPTLMLKKNDFSDFQSYFLLCAMPLAISLLKMGGLRQTTPPEILDFILHLLKFNDNLKNQFSDSIFRANLIVALANTISPSATMFEPSIPSKFASVLPSQQLPVETSLPPKSVVTSPDILKILTEIVCQINLEKLPHNASYRYSVTQACLLALRHIQKMGHIPIYTLKTLFKNYTTPGNFLDVRLAAFQCLLEVVKDNALKEEIDWIFSPEFMESQKESTYLKHKIFKMLIDSPQILSFRAQDLDFINKLWALISGQTLFSFDYRLRCDAIELYFSLFGKDVPLPLRPLDDLKSATLSFKKFQTGENVQIIPTETLNLINNPKPLSSLLEPNDDFLNPSTVINDFTGNNLSNPKNIKLDIPSDMELDEENPVPKIDLTQPINFQDQFKRHLITEDCLSTQSSKELNETKSDKSAIDEMSSSHKKDKKKKHKHHHKKHRKHHKEHSKKPHRDRSLS
ncbi:transcription initiation factor TFIID subunit 2-like isoform X1 [Gordionus sp. m RMFG-2023]|uniref:transcription initiation factor TFIID subunit 2-like isoform X1 n=1 Tax=Gordionus sp. m RMFG-2023 TaxID=3053472 RepID=UPI0031FD8A1F